MPNSYRAGEHYTVKRHPIDKTITALVCLQCSFTVTRFDTPAPGATSGRPRYNKMRGKMVHHVHECHAQVRVEEPKT